MDHSFIRGYVHVDEGLRLMDFLNTRDQHFIVVTEASAQNIGDIRSFKLVSELTKRHGIIALNKDSIKWIEEVKGKDKDQGQL